MKEEKILDQLTTLRTPIAEKREAVAEDETIAKFKAFYKKVCETKDYGVKENDRTKLN